MDNALLYKDHVVSEEKLADIITKVEATFPRDKNSPDQEPKDLFSSFFDSFAAFEKKFELYFDNLEPEEKFEAYRYLWEEGIASEDTLEKALGVSEFMSPDNKKIALQWLDNNAPQDSQVKHQTSAEELKQADNTTDTDSDVQP